MTVKTEGAPSAEFILSEANFHRSRDSGEVASGNNLTAGTVLMNDGGTRLIAWTGDEFTNGEEDEAVGILIAATDATSGHVKAAYIARDAEVNLNLISYPTGKQALVVQSLARRGIICRS